MTNTGILVVEDEGLIAQDICRTLQRLGYMPLGPLSSGEAAISQVATLAPQLILMDISLKGKIDGIDASKAIRKDHDIPIVFLTAYSDEEAVQRAQLSQPYGFVIKPFEERELYAAIETALHRHGVEVKLQQVERWLNATLNSIGDAVIATSIDGTITFLNPVAEQLTGWSHAEAVGSSLDKVFVLYDAEGVQLTNPLIQVLADGQMDHLPAGTQLQTRKGIFLAVDDSIAPIRDARGRVSGVVIVFRDVTLQRLSQAQLEYAAFYDALTGLANRTRLIDRLNHALTQYQRHPELRFAVLCLDLDRFKLVNDSFGHLVGDQLLVAVARRLEGCVRAGDTVARFGGDEFVILLENVSDESAIRVVERIHEVFSAPITLEDRLLFTKTSIGIAFSASHYDEPTALLRDADAALYEAKSARRGGFVIFDHTLHTQVRAQLQLETDLRWAVQRNEFQLYYQPIKNLATGQLYGFEALLRWQHPERGLLSPTVFFDTLEDINLSVSISHWVLREACAQLGRLQQLHAQPLVMSINLSDQQLRDPQLKELITLSLAEWQLQPTQLQLEVTERVLLDEQATMIIAELAALDVQLAIDDFGTGHSALNVLHQYQLSTLKIDRSFVVDLQEHHRHGMVQTIALIARQLGLHIVAEGIETEQQRSILAELGCNEGQGYWFARPMSADALEAYLLTGGTTGQ
jgi:diguanylate cyclase (GGDEF)-like protein/PAS domain S-box-containing protein